MSNNSVSYIPVQLQISNAQPGQRIAIRMSANGVQVGFSMGAPFSNNSGAQVSSYSGVSLPISSINITDSEVQICTSSQAGGGSALNFAVQLWLAGESGIATCYLQSTSDPGVLVTAALDSNVALTVNATPTLFSWS